MPPKSRTYEGCWTCRSRKVKCDLARPGCNRCRNYNKVCEGYDIKLGWSEPLTIGPRNDLITLHREDGSGDGAGDPSIQRRKIRAVEFPKSSTYKTFKQVDLALEKVDARADGKRLKVGPFSVFQMDIRTSTQIAPNHSINSKEPPSEQDVTPSSPMEDNENTSSIFSKTNNSWIHFELLDYAKLTILALKGMEYDFNEQNMFHILYPKFFPNLDSDDWEANTSILNKLFKFNSPSQSQQQSSSSQGIVFFPLFNTLLNSFTQNISQVMRVKFPKNYWEKVIVPFVYKIFGEFLHSDTRQYDLKNGKLNATASDDADNDEEYRTRSPEENLSHIKICIVYLVLSLSSFQQQKEDEGYLRLSIELRKLSVTILSRHIDEYGDDEDDDIDSGHSTPSDDLEYEELLLLGIILQLLMDTYFSIFENFDYLYGNGENLITEKFLKHDRKDLSDLSLYLIEMFNYHHVFYESTQSINMFNYSVDEEELKKVYKDIGEDYNLIKGSDNESSSSSENDDSDESETETEDLEETQQKSESTSFSSSVRQKRSIEPVISNLISPEDENITFTINFRGNDKGSNDSSRAKKRKTEGMGGKSRILSREALKPFVPLPSEMGYNRFNSELFYLSYGIPKSLITLFSQIISLTNHKNVLSQKKLTPRNFPKICADVEDALMSWDESNYWILFGEGKQFISDFHEGLYHNIKSFHHSLIVYYNQLIKERKTSGLQDHIRWTLGHLKELIALNKRSNRDVKFKPSYWQILICAAEASDVKVRKQFEEIWVNDEFEDKANYWRAKQIIYEVWKRRELGDDVTWMDVVREWEVVMSLA